MVKGRAVAPEDATGVRVPLAGAAERAVLGACLVSESALLRALDAGLYPESFYEDAHQAIWARMVDVGTNSGALDVLMLSSSLRSVGELKRAGGLSYLTQLVEWTPDPGHVEHYAELVLEAARKRQLMGLGRDLLARAGSEEVESREVFDWAADRLLAVRDGRESDEVDLGAAAVEELGRLQAMARGEIEDRRVYMGIASLDQAIGGMESGEFALVGAMTGVGKTSFMCGVAQAACEAGLSVVIWSGEMTRRQMVWRFWSRLTGISVGKMRRNLLGAAEWASIEMAQRVIRDRWKLRIIEGRISPGRLRTRCRSRQIRSGLDLVVVDYLQLMQSDVRTENRTQQVSSISRGLKEVATGLRVPILAGSQFHRPKEEVKGASRRPQLSWLKESGSLEQDADLVLLLDRKTQGSPTEQREARVYLAKGRNVEVGDWPLAYDPPTCRFEEGV